MQCATRIHFELLRELGQGLDIERMLQSPRYARDVLLVCDAFAGTEMAQLAAQFRRAAPAPYPVSDGGHAQQPIEWSRVSTGFGVSRPMTMSGPEATSGLESGFAADPVPRAGSSARSAAQAEVPHPSTAAGSATQALRARLARWLHR
jgi:hypothetical protein